MEEVKGFRIDEILTIEEQSVAMGVAKGMKFDKDDINKQLILARKNKNK